MRSYFAILGLGTHKHSVEIPGSSCFARDASVPMFAKLHLHLLLQLVQQLHLLQTHCSFSWQSRLQFCTSTSEEWISGEKKKRCDAKGQKITYWRDSAQKIWNSLPLSGKSGGPHFAQGALCQGPCCHPGLLVTKYTYLLRCWALKCYEPAWPVQSKITKAALFPSRPPLPNIWASSHGSFGSPGQSHW